MKAEECVRKEMNTRIFSLWPHTRTWMYWIHFYSGARGQRSRGGIKKWFPIIRNDRPQKARTPFKPVHYIQLAFKVPAWLSRNYRLRNGHPHKVLIKIIPNSCQLPTGFLVWHAASEKGKTACRKNMFIAARSVQQKALFAPIQGMPGFFAGTCLRIWGGRGSFPMAKKRGLGTIRQKNAHSNVLDVRTSKKRTTANSGMRENVPSRETLWINDDDA